MSDKQIEGHKLTAAKDLLRDYCGIDTPQKRKSVSLLWVLDTHGFDQTIPAMWAHHPQQRQLACDVRNSFALGCCLRVLPYFECSISDADRCRIGFDMAPAGYQPLEALLLLYKHIKDSARGFPLYWNKLNNARTVIQDVGLFILDKIERSPCLNPTSLRAAMEVCNAIEAAVLVESIDDLESVVRHACEAAGHYAARGADCNWMQEATADHDHQVAFDQERQAQIKLLRSLLGDAALRERGAFDDPGEEL